MPFKSLITENIPFLSHAYSLFPVVLQWILLSVLAWCLQKSSQSCFHIGHRGCRVWMHHPSHCHHFFSRWQQVERMSQFIIIINISMCGLMNGAMGILLKCESVVHAFEDIKIKLNQKQLPYAVPNLVIWWPFADALSCISTTLLFANDSSNSCQDVQKQLNEEPFSKMFSHFCYQIHLVEISLGVSATCLLWKTLFVDNVETSNINYSHLLQQNQRTLFPSSKSIDKNGSCTRYFFFIKKNDNTFCSRVVQIFLN